jgi:hypothetical protein
MERLRRLLLPQPFFFIEGKRRAFPPESSFGIYVDFLRAAKGGFFLMKKPLERVLSVYTNSETAIAAQNAARVGHPG